MTKSCFSYVLHNTKRKIVVHHTFCIKDMISLLDNNDLVFFDDCLYSQYVFMAENIDKLKAKDICCVLGFSSKIFRHNNAFPIYEADCAEFHNRVHNGDKDALNAYMTIREIEELLQHNNVYLACHGSQHLDLKNMGLSKLQQMHAFTADIDQASVDLGALNQKTSIFVFPYAYDQFPLAYKILNDRGFHFIFAGQDSKRIQIEDVACNACCVYNGI